VALDPTGLQTPRASQSLAIALANKLARIAWAVLARGRNYEPRITPNAA
jgi:hypothetical protein